jgi:hypothetical protein
MFLDCREYPAGYTFAEVAGKALGMYVNVADFTMAGGKRIFRMIVDAEITREQIKTLLSSSVRDQFDVYTFYQLEAITGPAVDQGPRMSPAAQYLRITFM